jgi:osmotically-inducible protein OsmY
MRRRLDWSTDFASDPRDRALRTRISSRIEGDPAFWLRRDRPGTLIVVNACAGCVTITGYVRTAGERTRVEAMARQLGARRVDNQLQILPGPSTHAA